MHTQLLPPLLMFTPVRQTQQCMLTMQLLLLRLSPSYMPQGCGQSLSINADKVTTSADFTPYQDKLGCRKPITAIEWSPREGSVLCTSSADGTVGVWDLSVERDAEEEAALGATGAPCMPFCTSGVHIEYQITHCVLLVSQRFVPVSSSGELHSAALR